jgi:SAM-dependent methyltransferase
MTTATAAQRRWLAAHWPFVQSHVPPAPGHVLEIGCGPAGGFVPAMREHGYDAIGVDPAAPSGPSYDQTTFEHREPAEPADAIVACTSLHHVGDVDEILDRVAATLTPGGVLIVVDWAYERFDESTARWCFDRLSDADEPGWLHGHRDGWLASDQPWHAYLGAWAQREQLHSGQAITQALQRRFDTSTFTLAPYFFPDLHDTGEADELSAANCGTIQATGIRYVATKPAIAGTPAVTVGCSVVLEVDRALVHLVQGCSLALHRRFGFTEVGTFREYALKNGRYISSVWMQRPTPFHRR